MYLQAMVSVLISMLLFPLKVFTCTNDPIIQNAIPAQIINVGQQYTFTFAANTFKNLGNTPLTYNASLGR